jgi:glycosyltransferase involved in cell wall biosynthesis
MVRLGIAKNESPATASDEIMTATSKFLTALPVYNEVKHVDEVLDEVLRYSPHVLVVDDGSTDGTAEVLKRRSDVQCVRHKRNQGYGAGLRTAFEYALAHDYDVLVTIDCDGQHQPRMIPDFVAAAAAAQIVSGSRYLKAFPGQSAPPIDRRRINVEITAELNRRLGLNLTDGFCGFKSYRRDALEKLHITETGYAMPLEVWVQAAKAGLKIVELGVPLIYLEEERSFGGSLDDATKRLEYYYVVLERAMEAAEDASQAGNQSEVREVAG